MRKELYEIDGMSCAVCASRIDKVVKKQKGVKKVSVNLLTNSMSVSYDETLISTEAIIEAVNNLGFVATLKGMPKGEVKNKDMMLVKLICSLIFTIPLFYICMGMMASWPLPGYILDEKNHFSVVFFLFLLTLPVIFINQNYFVNGFKNLYHRSPNMDSLIALGALAALLYGIYTLFVGANALSHHQTLGHDVMMNVYFESAAMILTLITLGKYLEGKAKKKTTSEIEKLLNLTPPSAIKIIDEQEVEVAVKEIQVGDILVLKAGMSVPVDGVVISGGGSLNEAMLTGESNLVDKTLNAPLIGGTIVVEGSLRMEATSIGDATVVAKIIDLVQTATSSKAPISKLADKIASFFVPIVLFLSILSGIVWWISGQSFEFSLLISVAVLVISCPCALGLATPTAVMVGLGKGAHNGILIKDGDALQKLAQIDVIVLDKTGTITTGNPQVENVVSFVDDFLILAASIESHSLHPYAKSIVELANGNKLKEVEDFEVLLGRGIKGKIEGKVIYGGSKKLLEELGIKIEEEQGKSIFYFVYDSKLIGYVELSDQIHPSSKQAIASFNKMGKEVVMLTGDNEYNALKIANQVGISHVEPNLKPDDKYHLIKQYQQAGKKVLMIGDGINDAVALVQADVGMAIGKGSDIAIESADIVLLHGDLSRASKALKLGHKTMKNIKENLFWAFFYNVICIPLAMGVLYPHFGILLNPVVAAFAMSFSSVFVVFNALCLRLVKLGGE